MNFDVLTLFPQFFDGFIQHSIIGRAVDKGTIKINLINIRDFAKNKHKQADDYPYGGGAGMVMLPQPLADSIKYALSKYEDFKPPVIYMSPQGKVFNQKMAAELSKEKALIFLCGHYEGIDQRIIDKYVDMEVSVGDYVLTGGELPSMIMIDAVARLIPGVLGSFDSVAEESHTDGLLEYPHYTRPQEFEGMSVPDVLLSGNHKEIEKWRRYESIRNTFLKRPDLLKNADLTNEEKHFIVELEKKK